MKKILLIVLCAFWMLSPRKASAQSFSVADTVWQIVPLGTTATINDYITNLTGSTLNLHWTVIATSFPADWLTDTALNLCDNVYCRQNSSGQLWNGTSGMPFISSYTANAAHDTAENYDMLLNLTYATSTGSHYLTVRITDPISTTSTTTTFVINKWSTAVTNINNTENDVVLYPNPAHDEVNIVYDPSNDIKNIVVYNIIGKVLSVYKVTNNTSANLNLENIPSGIYFVRLFNSHGDVVVTRKFTKQ